MKCFDIFYKPVFSCLGPCMFLARSTDSVLNPLKEMNYYVTLTPHTFRYAILAPKAIPAGFMDGRKACELLLSAVALETSEYRLGHSKVFFRAGVLGNLEDMRDERLGKVLTQLQAYCRGYAMRKTYRKLLDQRYVHVCDIT